MIKCSDYHNQYDSDTQSEKRDSDWVKQNESKVDDGLEPL